MKCILVVLCITFCMANALQFKDCGSKAGQFTKIEVSDCDITKSVCTLKRNTNATISIDFDLEIDEIKEVTAVVHGIIMGIEMPFPLDNPNGCANSGLTCPLTKPSKNEYQATLAVLKSYPKVKVDVKWELRDENAEIIICVIIPAKIE